MRIKLLKIQSELRSPKLQKNTFGNYNYRSCEDILEAVKPLCVKHNCCLTLSDEIIEVGGRIYVKSTAKIEDNEKGSDYMVQSSAFAREAEIQKGMSEPQITGSASSYARKYALNGLFCIDDTKDDDTRPPKDKEDDKPKEKPKGVISKALPAIKGATDLKTLATLESFIDKNSWTEDELKELDLAISAKKGDFK
jgi:hypothetical protein